MKQRPDRGALERLAGEILRDDPLAEDGQARGYKQRLAVKALSIAAWDREHGAAGMAEEIDLFTKLYGEEIVESGCDDDKVRVASLNLLLAGDIRVGIWDEAPGALWNLLMAQTRARLRRVNPRYLKSREGGQD